MMSRTLHLLLLTALYSALRLFSFFFTPETSFHTAHVANHIMSGVLLAITLILLIQKDNRGWYIIAGEMILGGSGGYLALGSISLRTLLLVGSMCVYFGEKLAHRELTQTLREHAAYTLFTSLLLLTIIGGALNGALSGHNFKLILADVIPYGFLLYYYPLAELLRSEKFKAWSHTAILIAILCNLGFILTTQIGFSTHFFTLQDAYYHWYRDVASGKITDAGFNYFRLVLNEHLLLVPLLIITTGAWLKKQHSHFFSPLTTNIALLSILAMNLTRIYFVSLAAGFIALFSRLEWKRWLQGTLMFAGLFLTLFMGLHLSASRGKSLGLELFGLRLQSIVTPHIEDSSLSRLLLLEPILTKIKARPLIGQGVGDTVTVFSPVLKQTIATPHYDWGYLEILGELGTIGALIWLIAIAHSLRVFYRTSRILCASFISLLIINITSPALFHALGILFIASAHAYAYTLKPTTL